VKQLLPLIDRLWRPALEILILAVGLYYAFIFVRRTRGWPVVTGFLGLLMAVTLTTKLLKLTVLTSLLNQFFAFAAVAIVVIFQPELRRILAELGNLPLFNSARVQRENIEVIIETVDRLASVRIGALIAIEQSINLSEAVESGVVVDCEATPEMLETIFFPNNAIHDGGVIVKHDRILKAACIFPLTQREDLQKSVGTRHRAAIGLSEETDAVIVVVSEETGGISYAHRGHLTRGVSVNELRAFLTRVLLNHPKPRGPLQRLRDTFNWRGLQGAKPAE
jgi:diadenylate cyclase